MAAKLIIFAYAVLLSCLNCHGIVEAYEYVADAPADICCDEETENKNGCHCGDIAATIQTEAIEPDQEDPELDPNEVPFEVVFSSFEGEFLLPPLQLEPQKIPEHTVPSVARHIQTTILRL